MINKFKSYLESIKITPISWLSGVSGVLMVRFFLESLSNPTSSGYFASDASTLIHYYLFFMAAFVIYMIVFQYAVPSWKKIAPQFIAVSSLIIFIAPVIDWLATKGSGLKMTYFFDAPRDILLRFLTFGGTNLHMGATLGLRIELALMVIGFGTLSYLVERKMAKAIIYAFVLYLVILAFALIPTLTSIISQAGQLFPDAPLAYFQKTIANSSTTLNNLHGTLQYSSFVRLFEISFNFIMGKILFLTLIISASFWFHLNFKEKFKAIIGDLRSNRTIHFILMIFLGLFSAYLLFPAASYNWNDWLSAIMLCLSLYFSIRFAICTNDIVDEEIDSVTNSDRPLVTKVLDKNDMKQSAAIFLLGTIVSGFLAGYTSLFFILTFTALYYIYSAPPTRFKLIPFFSSFLIGLCSLAAALSGFFLFSANKYVSAFPPKLSLMIVVMLTLLTGIRDIKDIEGDKVAGVKTVPIIFGDKWGIKVVGLLAALSYILVTIISGVWILFSISIPAAIATYYFSVKKPYVEKYIFYIYFAFLFAVLLLLLF